MEIDSDLKLQSIEFAVKVYESIINAYNLPTNRVEGDALKIFEELSAWEFFDNYPIQNESNKWLYVTVIASQHYRHLKWRRDHPQKVNEKKSKWEIVHGKLGGTAKK